MEAVEVISPCTQRTPSEDIVSGDDGVQDVSMPPTASIPVLAAPVNGSFQSTKATAAAEASEFYDLFEDDYRTHSCTSIQIKPWK